MAGLPGFASHGSSLHLGAGCIGSPWMSQAPSLYFSDAVVNLDYFPVFRDSTGSSGSHQGQTASVPQTLKLSTESDSQSDGKMDVSSDNDQKPDSFKRPEPRSSVQTQPPCEPTLLYESESDDGSPIKRPKHPEARIKGRGPSYDPTLLCGSESDDGSPIKRPKHPEAEVSDKGPSCEQAFLYGAESDDGSPIKRPKHPEAGILDKDPSGSDDGTPQKRPKQLAASNEPTLLYESDAKVAPIESDIRGDGHHASYEQTLVYSDVSEEKPTSLSDKSSANVAENRTNRPDIQQQPVAIKDADATVLYADAEMSSTDDEEESGMVYSSVRTIIKRKFISSSTLFVCLFLTCSHVCMRNLQLLKL